MTSSLEPGIVLGGRFELERVAGRGGMGEVFRAKDQLTGHLVALKVLDGDGEIDRERFAREVDILASLDHPAIVRYVAHGLTPRGRRWLAMEWVEGESLSARLAREGLRLSESVALAARVASALAALHGRGVVHRDLKPSNLMLPDGDVSRVKLIDFGVARRPTHGAELTATGAMLGTPGYMAPEQARGQKSVDARADVFALGAVLFHCAAGRAPFAADDRMAVLLKVVLEDAPRLGEVKDDVSPALEALVARMLAKAPEARPADGAEALAELRALAAVDAPLSVRAPASRVARELTERERRVVSLVLALPPEPGGDADADATRRIEPSASGTGTVRMDPPHAAHGDARRAAALRVAEAFAGRAELFSDGSAVVALSSAGAATDLAGRAARAALALRADLPDAAFAVVSGRSALQGKSPIGELIERAVGLGGAARGEARAPGSAAAIALDDTTLGLLGDAFETTTRASAQLLLGERAPSGASRTVLGRSTPFVGRDRELSTLEATFVECATESVARAVIVTGPPGIGKTRLRRELVARLRVRAANEQIEPPDVWTARGDEMRAGAAFGLLAELVCQAAGVARGEPADTRRARLAAWAERSLAPADARRVAPFLGELVGAPFPDDGDFQLRAARADPQLMGDQMRRAFEDLLRAASARRPLVLVLEDLHWGDLPTVSFLDAALRALKAAPLLVLALARPEVHDAFPKLWADRGALEIRLSELTPRASERLVQKLLGDGATPELVTRLVERADGNAFYLEELVRATAEGRGAGLPDTVVAMVAVRLEALAGELRRALRAASVFGQVFWKSAVLALVGAKAEPEVAEWLRELERREVTVRQASSHFPGDEEFAFRHALLREAAYAMLTEEDRALGHRLAGAWLEQKGVHEAALVAEHYERGKAPARAVPFYRAAVEQALEGSDLVSVIALAERAIAAGAAGEDRGRVLVARAEAHRWRGEFAAGAAAADEALGLLAHGSARWCAAACERIAQLSQVGGGDEALPVVQDLRRADVSRDAEPAWARAMGHVGKVVLLNASRYDLADLILDDSAELEARTGAFEPSVEANVARLRSLRAIVRGDMGSCADLCSSQALAFERAGDLRNAWLAHVHAACAMMHLGKWAAAEAVLADAAAGADRIGLAWLATGAEQNRGYALAHLGRLAEGRAAEERALAVFVGLGDKRMTGCTRTYLARICTKMGEPDAGEREARAAVAELEGVPSLRAQAWAAHAEALLARGRVSAALASAREADGLLTSLGGVEEGEGLVRVVTIDALLAQGNEGLARDKAAAARKWLLERAATISSADDRACFLQAIPEHARILELTGGPDR